MRWSHTLRECADDLDAIEEQAPAPGRVGRANTLRDLAAAMEGDNRYGVRFLCACGCGTEARLTLSGASVVGALSVREVPE